MPGRCLFGRRGAVAVAVFAVAAVAAPAADAKGGYEAKITRNKQGIPTIEAEGQDLVRVAYGIEADSYKDLGFGYGYAFAEDEICVIADTYLTGNAERSKWFGPDAKSPEGFTNLDSVIPPADTVGELLDTAVDHTHGTSLADSDRDQLIAYLSHTGDPNEAVTTDLRRDRLPGLVGLLMASPYFQWY